MLTTFRRLLGAALVAVALLAWTGCLDYDAPVQAPQEVAVVRSSDPTASILERPLPTQPEPHRLPWEWLMACSAVGFAALSISWKRPGGRVSEAGSPTP